MPDTPIRITITSDYVCPWCWIGETRLRRAVEAVADDLTVLVARRPFELNPGMPAGGMDRRTYRTRKFGSWQASLDLDARITAEGAKDGLVYRFDRQTRTPNSLDAHRLAWLAGREGHLPTMAEALFRAYFHDGQDIGDHRVLARLAPEAGVDAERARAFLAGDDGRAEVEGELRAAATEGISGVPYFRIGPMEIPGAVPTAVLVQALVVAHAADDGAAARP